MLAIQPGQNDLILLAPVEYILNSCARSFKFAPEDTLPGTENQVALFHQHLHRRADDVGLDVGRATPIAVGTIKAFLKQNPPLEEIRFVCFTAEIAAVYNQELLRRKIQFVRGQA